VRFATDKIQHGYMPTYLRIAADLGPAARVCEVGVWGGGSLHMWQALFPDGLVAGVDANPDCRWPDGTHRIVAAQDDPALPVLLAQHAPAWDLIVEDASHDGALSAATFRLLWHWSRGRVLRAGGLDGRARLGQVRRLDGDTAQGACALRRAATWRTSPTGTAWPCCGRGGIRSLDVAGLGVPGLPPASGRGRCRRARPFHPCRELPGLTAACFRVARFANGGGGTVTPCAARRSAPGTKPYGSKTVHADGNNDLAVFPGVAVMGGAVG
jgi:hypothetical protein